MREISIDECLKVAGGDIIVNGQRWPAPGSSDGDDGGLGASMYLSMYSSVVDYAQHYGQNAQQVSENPEADGDMDGDGVPDSVDTDDARTITVNGLSEGQLSAIKEASERMAQTLIFLTGIGAGTLVVNSWKYFTNYLASIVGNQAAANIAAGAASTYGEAGFEDWLAGEIENGMIDRTTDDLADDGIINMSNYPVDG